MKGQLASIILSQLGEAGGLSGRALLKRLQSSGARCSKQAMYAHLREFEAKSMIVRAGQLFSLSLPWCVSEIEQRERWMRTILQRKSGSGLPLPSSKIRLRFSSLSRLDFFWSQIITRMMVQSGEQQVFQWVPYPWFVVVNPSNEEFLQMAFRRAKKNIKLVTPHARAARPLLEMLPSDLYAIYASDTKAFKLTEYLTVVVPYIFSFTIGGAAETTLRDGFLGKNIQSLKGFSDLRSKLLRPVTVNATIEHNAVKAEGLARTLASLTCDE